MRSRHQAAGRARYNKGNHEFGSDEVFFLSPPLILALVVSSVYAALFNLWRNGSLRDLSFYLLAAWVGFGLGQVAGWLLHFHWGMVGSVRMVEGTLFCWSLILLMSWLRMPQEQTFGR